MKPLIIASGRQPFEVLLLLACVLTAGLGLAVPGAGSTTIDAFIPMPWNTVFYVALGASATVGLIGVSLQVPVSLLVERIGLLFLSGLLIAYGIALYALYGAAVGASGAIIVAFGTAALTRSVQITMDLRKLHQALRRSAAVAEPLLADPSTGDEQ